MANVARRSFLKLIGVAPVAGPVAAKEAAAKMGLQGVIGGALMRGGPGEACAPQPWTQAQEVSWLKENLATWQSDEQREERRYYERDYARQLDGDIAALRSVSPSYAYMKQLDRNVDRRIERETSSIRKQLRKLGVPFV
jgi:hypothetical protein